MRFVWGSVFVSMTFIVIVWGFSIKQNFGELSKNDEYQTSVVKNETSPTGDIKDAFEELSRGMETMKSNYAASEDTTGKEAPKAEPLYSQILGASQEQQNGQTQPAPTQTPQSDNTENATEKTLPDQPKKESPQESPKNDPTR